MLITNHKKGVVFKQHLFFIPQRIVFLNPKIIPYKNAQE